MSPIRTLLSCFLAVGLLASPSTGSEDAKPMQAPDEYRTMENPVEPTEDALKAIRPTYQRRCSGCHGVNGDGKGRVAAQMGIHATNFTDASGMATFEDGELFYWISKGRDPMPTFEKKLTEQDRWTLVHFIRDFASQGDGGEATAVQP